MKTGYAPCGSGHTEPAGSASAAVAPITAAGGDMPENATIDGSAAWRMARISSGGLCARRECSRLTNRGMSITQVEPKKPSKSAAVCAASSETRQYLRNAVTATRSSDGSSALLKSTSHSLSQSALASTSEKRERSSDHAKVCALTPWRTKCACSCGSCSRSSASLALSTGTGGCGNVSSQPAPQCMSTHMVVSKAARSSVPNSFTKGKASAGR